jgi:hypothetical protein
MKYCEFTLLNGNKLAIPNTSVSLIQQGMQGALILLTYAIEIEGQVLQKIEVQESIQQCIAILNA